MPDAHTNFAYSLVATAPSPASSGTSLVVTAGQGALFPAVPFNATIWPTATFPTSTNAEIVRVTAKATDTLTITRAQESSSARTVVVGDQIAATATAKTFTDIEAFDTGKWWRGTAGTTTSRENYDQAFAYSNGAAIAATQVMWSGGILLYAGDTVSNIVFRSGTVAAGTPTNWWFALYDTAKNLMVQTADQTTAAWAANTTMDLALTASQSITTTGIYYGAVMVKATTVPNMQGVNNAATITLAGYQAGRGIKAQTSGAALTTTAPASIAAPTTTGIMVPRFEVHD